MKTVRVTEYMTFVKDIEVPDEYCGCGGDIQDYLWDKVRSGDPDALSMTWDDYVESTDIEYEVIEK